MAASEHETSPPLACQVAAASADASPVPSATAWAAAAPPRASRHGHDEATSQLQLQAQEAPVPRLEPLFTLLTNATTRTTVHPRVRYVFADDDLSALTDAPAVDECGRPMRTLVVDLAPPCPPPRQAAASSSSLHGRASQLAPAGPLPLALPSWSSSSLPRDVHSGGWTVAGAASLSPDFAVTDARLCDAALQSPGGPASSTAAAGAPVLRVEGVEREPVDGRPPALSASASASGALALSRQDMDTLADEFRRRVGILRGVAVEAHRRSAALARLHDEQQQHHQLQTQHELLLHKEQHLHEHNHDLKHDEKAT
ncbi:hypothetical protein CDD81_4472 [Ophiocordyceps australis]|uniref:Uncharacterized protein n=1 Tax=Ophiocordyceps australis TaxID=1399860 RepID=A0A2C5YEC8_9HYPO|nr:hypothetical protein CDD81_4472 [Ophiocordyceps australis]